MTVRARENNVLVTEVARALLSGVARSGPAPVGAQVRAERRAFEALSSAYFADPRRALAGADAGGGYLKFGLPGAEELLTPVFLAAASEILTYLSERAGTITRRTVRQMLSPPDPSPGGPELTREQWAHVRRVMVAALMRHGRMPREKAETIASAAVGDGLVWPGEPE